jgi:hypothetical protein
VLLQTKLQERDDALAQRQSQILELHTELSQLQRLLKLGPSGSAAAAAAGGLRSSSLRMSGGLQQPGSPGTAGGWGGGGCGYDERGSHAAAAAMLGCCSYSPGRGGSGGNRAGLRSRGSAEDEVAAATDGEWLLREMYGLARAVMMLAGVAFWNPWHDRAGRTAASFSC